MRDAPARDAAAAGEIVTVAGVVARAAQVLEASGITDARSEARDLVAALVDAPRHWPALHAGDVAEDALRAAALRAAGRRAKGAPLAYAVGRASFRHLTLAVDERVLIPRPETELLVEIVLGECGAAPGGTVVDVGTGSGAIALALAQEGSFARVIATDVSRDALAVAQENARTLAAQLRAPVEFRHGSLLDPVDGAAVWAIVANPPYIAFDEAAALPASVRDWEPAIALFSADRGLADTARLVRQAAARLEARGLLALEVDARRASLVAELVSADARYEDVSVRLDLAGRERFVVARRREQA
jgi:release factor glutamine methyltransferase